MPTVTVAEAFSFRVKEQEDGTPWIALEPAGSGLPGIKGVVGLQLIPGTSFERAEEIARLLDEAVKEVSYTSWD
ncbi:MAG: hypothetical protein KDK07_21640 [Bauldia sp.]|nr:hypothetical protein [Bauldia sp.]